MIVPAIIVLAAGAGSRYGQAKQAVPIAGKPMLLRVLDALDGFGDPQIVVLGAHEQKVRGLVPLDRWQPVLAGDWHVGPGASLRAGLRAVPNADAALVVLGDLPWLREEAIRQVLDAAARSDAEAVRAFDGEVPGHPLLLRGTLLERARQAPDAGMAALLRNAPVMAVRPDGLGVAQDVDVPSDA